MQIGFCQAADLLQSRNKFLILTHKNPDGDTIGCACALARILRGLGKLAYIHRNPGFSERYSKYLDGLCVEDFEPECVISVDVADYKLLPVPSQVYAERVDLAIDHHETHREFAKDTLLDAQAAACGEVIYTLAEELGFEIDDDIAAALYVAISTDTGCFQFSNTTAESHYIAGDLMHYNVDIAAIHREFFTIKSRARLAVEAKLIETMRIYSDGKLAIMHLPLALLSEVGATEEDLDNISSLARTVEGVELGVLIRELSGGKTKISARSGENVNAAELCAVFGGGGHIRAAGCDIEGTPEIAEEKILKAIADLKIF